MKSSSFGDQEYFFNKFQQGNEKGFDYFYKLLYPSLYNRGVRYIKDDLNADCIVKEAFLRLWIIRKNISDPGHLETFLKTMTSQAWNAYYKTSANRFQKSMLRLDEIENYQEFMCGYLPEYEDESDLLYQQELDKDLIEKRKKLEAIIPSLTQDQQMFIRLCLKHSFNYDRIAGHLGGISDYQVGKKVEKTLASLKAILSDTQKLNSIDKTTRFRFEGDVCEEQSAILHMRYALHYSFEEIATALKRDQGYIQKAFAIAWTKIKKIKI